MTPQFPKSRNPRMAKIIETQAVPSSSERGARFNTRCASKYAKIIAAGRESNGETNGEANGEATVEANGTPTVGANGKATGEKNSSAKTS